MSSFWLVLKQQWTIEEIFINSSHLEWRAGLSDTILKGTHPTRFGLIWLRGFRLRRTFNTKNNPIHYTTTQGIQLNLRKICRSRIFSLVFLLKWRFPYTNLDYFIRRSVKQDHSVTFVPSCVSPLVLAVLFMPYWLH